MNSWFRFYNEVLDDPKIQKLTPEQFRAWVNMLCLASKNGGVLPMLEHVSFAFRETQEKTQGLISELIGIGLIDRKRSGALCPHNWDSRQFKSDCSTDRVKRFRKRSKSVTETLSETHQTQNRTEQIQSGNVSSPSSPYSTEFEAFWVVYPRHVGKGDAWKSWLRLKPSQSLQIAMIQSLHNQKQSQAWKRENGQFIPHPATWLNQRRWDDDLNPPKQNGGIVV